MLNSSNTTPAASRRLALLAGAALLGSAPFASQAQSVFDDFNAYATAPSLDANYNFATTAGAWNLSATGLNQNTPGEQGLGLGSSEQYLIRDTAFSLANGPITFSLFFRRGTGGEVAIPQIGLLSVNEHAGNPFINVNNEISVRLNGANSAWQVRNLGNTANTGSANTLVTGQWYFLTATFTGVSATNLSVSASLYNATNAGAVGTLVSSYSPGSFANSGIIADTTVYAGIRVHGSGVDRIDNLAITAIPEPSAFAALAGLGALGLAATRRRARR